MCPCNPDRSRFLTALALLGVGAAMTLAVFLAMGCPSPHLHQGGDCRGKMYDWTGGCQ